MPESVVLDPFACATACTRPNSAVDRHRHIRAAELVQSRSTAAAHRADIPQRTPSGQTVRPQLHLSRSRLKAARRQICPVKGAGHAEPACRLPHNHMLDRLRSRRTHPQHAKAVDAATSASLRREFPPSRSFGHDGLVRDVKASHIQCAKSGASPTQSRSSRRPRPPRRKRANLDRRRWTATAIVSWMVSMRLMDDLRSASPTAFS